MMWHHMTVPLRVPAGTGPGPHPEASPADPPDAILGPAMAALAMGDYRGAANTLDEVVSAKPGLARAHEMLGGIALGVLDDYPRALKHLEISYRLHREVGDFAAAARAAIALAQVEVAGGNGAGARGWLGRAKRLIDEIGPCVEEGYYRIAMVGCEVPDVIELEASSSRALEVARTFRDTNLEVRALADSGLALISLGRTADGLKRLDEALTAVISGEVRDLVTCGFTCCAVVSAGSLLGDIDRLTRLIENLRRVASERFNGFQPPILPSPCHQPYAAMRTEAARWAGAGWTWQAGTVGGVWGEGGVTWWPRERCWPASSMWNAAAEANMSASQTTWPGAWRRSPIRLPRRGSERWRDSAAVGFRPRGERTPRPHFRRRSVTLATMNGLDCGQRCIWRWPKRSENETSQLRQLMHGQRWRSSNDLAPVGMRTAPRSCSGRSA